MTKDEVLQKVNDYCSEKSYTSETLTDAFKDKFSEFYAKRFEGGDINDENVIEDIKFNLNTAFSSASKVITDKIKSFDTKEAEYKQQIEELKKKIQPKANEKFELPDDVKSQLDELRKFKDEQRLAEKYKSVVGLAKKSVREDLHKSLENYANDFKVNLDEGDDVQAARLTTRFQEIFKDSIGDIKPLAPKQVQKRDEEILDSIPKVKI